MAAASPPPLALLTLTLSLTLSLASAGLVLDDGYTVTTAADLNHPGAPAAPHPYALLPRPRAGDLVLLDSAASALYTLALPLSGGAAARTLAGGGGGPAGFADGEPRDAAFDRPRSLAVDHADNVYVADRMNGAVRKIAPSGERPLLSFASDPSIDRSDSDEGLGFMPCDEPNGESG